MTEPEVAQWRIHRAARYPARAVVALVVILLALFAIQAIGRSTLLTILAAVLLIGSIADYLFPTVYTLDKDGAHARHVFSHRLLPWSRVRRVYLRRNGIKLSPLVVAGWVEPYRGVLLQTMDRDATLTAIRQWLISAGVNPEIREE